MDDLTGSTAKTISRRIPEGMIQQYTTPPSILAVIQAKDQVLGILVVTSMHLYDYDWVKPREACLMIAAETGVPELLRVLTHPSPDDIPRTGQFRKAGQAFARTGNKVIDREIRPLAKHFGVTHMIATFKEGRENPRMAASAGMTERLIRNGTIVYRGPI